MDDILRGIKQLVIQTKLKEINALHPILKFTLEVEAEGKIHFLDLYINDVTDKLCSTSFCKPSENGPIMKYHALAPECYKKSVVEGLVLRVYRASSSWENVHVGMEKVKMMLQRNQHRQELYHPIISNTIEKLASPKRNQKGQEKDTTSQKSNVVKQNVFIEYRGIATNRFIKKIGSSEHHLNRL